MSVHHDDQARYLRQMVLPELGPEGQERLRSASVLVIGAGGLGSPLLFYLAAAGVGRIGIVDYDTVEESNLHRQILHTTDRIGTFKSESAATSLRALNPHIDYEVHNYPISEDNARDLVSGYDIVADGSDNFQTRDMVHTACFVSAVTLVSGAIQMTSGLLTTFKAHLGPPHPCFRCLYPDDLPSGLMPTCSEIGVLGPAAGVLGCLQAMEVLREILSIEGGLSGRLAMYDAWSAEITHADLPRRAECPACGSHQAAA